MRQLMRLTIRAQERMRRLFERNILKSLSGELAFEKDSCFTNTPNERRFIRQSFYLSRRYDSTGRMIVDKKIRQKLFKEVLEKQQKTIEALQERKQRLLKDVDNFQGVYKDVLHEKREQLVEAEKRFVERGKFIIQDFKETKDKVRDKMEEVVERENIYTVPNLLCVTRIVCSPYLGYLICTNNFEYALGFMAVAGVSDFLDGWIARNFKSQSSKLGSFLDPMADKVLIGTLFLSLTYVDLIPVPLTCLIVMRDVVLVIAGFVIRYKSLPPPRTLSRYFDATHATAQLAPTLISKINTGVQLGLVGVTLAAPVFNYIDHPALHFLWYLTATTTIAAAASYIASNDTYKYVKKKK